MKDFEKLVTSIMKECENNGEPVTRAEAEEMAKMELGAKEISHYAQSIESRKKSEKPKTVKVSDNKKSIFQTILQNLTRNEFIEPENIKVLSENKLIQVQIGEDIFKIDLIQQRKPKK